jgi:hypothetical protein
MPSALPRVLLAAALFAVAAGQAAADAVSEKQKALALENMKKAEIANATAVETEHLILVGAAPEAKLKTMAAALDKVYLTARKALKYEDKEKPFTGKLTVYYLPDRQLKRFVAEVVGERPEGSIHFALKGDHPFVAVNPLVPEKPTDADVAGEVGVAVGAALLARKAPTAEFPEWLRTGFGRAASLRAEGPGGKRYAAYKAQAKPAALGGKGKPPAPIAEVWNGGGRDSEVLATSLVDFMAFGPGAGSFGKFIDGFKPSESVPMPGVPQALEAAGWKEQPLELAWRKWVATGK